MFVSFLFGNSAEGRSTIGSYWIGMGYSGYSDDLTDGDAFVIASNFPVHENFDIGVSGHIGSLTVLDIDFLSYGISVDTKVHYKIPMGSVTIDPFFSVGIGLQSLESYTWQYVGSSYYYDYYQTVANSSVLVPYQFSIGSEFTFGEYFSLVPALGIRGIANEDIDSIFCYGIQANFLVNDHFSIGLSFEGTEESGKTFAVLGRYHL